MSSIKLHHANSLPAGIESISLDQNQPRAEHQSHYENPSKRFKLTENTSVDLMAAKQSSQTREVEVEVDSLRQQPEETQRLLKEKTIEVEKST